MSFAASRSLVETAEYDLRMSVQPVSKNPDELAAEIRERRALLEHGAEVYIALADRLDDEIAALETAKRLSVAAEDVDFDALLDRAERNAGEA